MKIETMIKEIYETVVKGKPSDDKLIKAAEQVVYEREQGSEWDDLSEAIRELAEVLEEGKH